MSTDAKRRYEVLLLLQPDISNDDAVKLEKGFAKIVEDYSGELISFERWGKYELAYPVKGNDYGIYFLARFEFGADTYHDAMGRMRHFFDIKHNDKVMRYMFTRLDRDEPLAYQRPESLEESPMRDGVRGRSYDRRGARNQTSQNGNASRGDAGSDQAASDGSDAESAAPERNQEAADSVHAEPSSSKAAETKE